ncbi:UNVERIFIED_CONTAM: hypothetical protein NCL1_16112 [Trichonephila clavipes]
MDWRSRRLAASNFRAYLRSWTSPSGSPQNTAKKLLLAQLLGGRRKPSWRAFLLQTHTPASFLRFSGVLFSFAGVRSQHLLDTRPGYSSERESLKKIKISNIVSTLVNRILLVIQHMKKHRLVCDNWEENVCFVEVT